MMNFDDWLKEQNQPASNFLRRETYEAGQQSKQKELDELKRLISDAIKGIEIELRYATSMGHEQAVKAYQNSLDSLIQCKTY